jgi:hypothetical protein
MITLQCRTCDEPMESMWFDENDIVTCTDCWGA